MIDNIPAAGKAGLATTGSEMAKTHLKNFEISRDGFEIKVFQPNFPQIMKTIV